MTITRERVESLLKSMGDSEEQVVATLRANHIKGLRDCADACPVANWLQKNLPEADEVRVQSWGVEVDYELEGEEELDYISLPPPTPVEQFVLDFDNGYYTDLDEDYDPDQEEGWE
jgi:hypothetical protein